MNPMYGENTIRPIEIDTIKTDSRDDFEKGISLNYNYGDSVLEVNGRYYIKKTEAVMGHFDIKKTEPN